MKYRSEIDGLRAVSVVAVLIFHLHLPNGDGYWLSGGYVGVDVFFVISGYLITSILMREYDRGSFSIVSFYERRARRILPALFAMLAVCVPLGWFFLLPGQFETVAKAAIASILFGSNLLFWREAGYFADPTELDPLIHTWSLGVEEQFYLFFPLVLFVILRRRKLLFPVMVLASIASLALAEWLLNIDRSAAFYLLPTRAWELLVGVLLSCLERRTKRGTTGLTASFAVIVGLGLILGAAVLMDDASRHPGLPTLAPVAGAALVIWFGGDNFGSAVLRLRPVVLVGLISYSLYLWHQPIFVFARLNSVSALTLMDYLPLIAASFGAAWVSWSFIEGPFRRRMVVTRKRLAALMSTAAAVLIVMSGTILALEGFPSRLPELVRSAATTVAQQRLLEQDGESCFPRDFEDRCVFHNGSDSRPWALVGDSHASMFAPALQEHLRAANIPFEVLAASGCMYAPGFGRVPDSGCADHNVEVRDYLMSGEPTTVIVAARYAGYISGDRFDNGEGGVEAGGRIPMAPVGVEVDENERIEMLQAGLRNGLQELADAGHRLVIIYPVPEVGWKVPAVLPRSVPFAMNAREDWFEAGGLATSENVFEARNERAYVALDGIQGDVTRVYPAAVLCGTPKALCITHTRDEVYYSDDDHLTREGVDVVLAEIFASLDDAAIETEVLAAN